MMDTQRLIAFVVFSFSALLLWDAWQKHNAPKVSAPVASTASAPAGVPQPTAPLSAAPAQPGAVAVPQVPASAAQTPAGEVITIRTDLLEVDLSTAGGDIRRVTFLKVFSAT